MIEIKELTSLDEMLNCFELLLEVYPTLTKEQYETELGQMIPNNYTQVVAIENDKIIGLSGIWVATKLWSGKYLEADNVVVAEKHRSKGVAKLLFDYMKEKAQNENCNMMSLDSYTVNFRAHKFFYNQDMVPKGFHFINILNEDGIR